MKAPALKSPRTEFLQSPMAITGAILAMGVIRLQDQMAWDKSAIQAVDRNLTSENELHQQQPEVRAPEWFESICD